MQDEVIKHANKVMNELTNPKHTVKEKLKEIGIEVFIIVFAVSLSIWLHSWSEHRHQQMEVREFSEDLKADLKNDIADLEVQNEYLKVTTKSCDFFKVLTNARVDSLLKLGEKDRVNLSLNPVSKIRNTGNYEGFKSSGKIGFIEDRKLKKMILNYYQKTASEKDDWQIYYNNLIFELAKEVNTTKYKKALDIIVESDHSKGYIESISSQAQQIVKINENVIEKAREIIKEVDLEAKK